MTSEASRADPILELRVDPTSGRQVLIAEGREARPTDLQHELPTAPAPAGAPENCPFCPGNEQQTPRELAVSRNAHGSWNVRVVPNKFPALKPAAPLPSATAAPLESLPAEGIHEVFIESPQHIADWQTLSVDQLAEVFSLYAARLRNAYQHYDSALIFKNVGYAAGASLSHIHSQLAAFPQTPATLQQELERTHVHFLTEGACLFCQIADAELTNPLRLAAENAHFVAVCAFAGRQPYETWILPREHSTDFSTLSDAQLCSLAKMFLDLLPRIFRLLNSPAYNLVLHTVREDSPFAASFHWHWELIPRTTSLAGFEWGTGMHINPLAPERAAQNLRDVCADGLRGR